MQARVKTLLPGQWVYSDPETVQIGDTIEFSCNGRGRAGHYRVTAVVTKVNRKTVCATEKERSYRPGTLWRVSQDEDSPVVISRS